MLYRAAADTVLIGHVAFIAFVVLGGFLARRALSLRLAHLVTVVYAVAIEVIGFTCPLTPLEKSLRRSAGQAGYEGGFVEHYVVPLIYPGGLDMAMKATLLGGLAVITVLAYWPSLVGSPLPRRWLKAMPGSGFDVTSSRPLTPRR